MNTFLSISIRLLDGRFHGLTDDGRASEWPPSPMRLYQALLAGAAPRWVHTAIRDQERPAFIWLEEQPAPIIIAPPMKQGMKQLTYVPNNNDPGKNERTGKFVQPIILGDDRQIEFRYAMDPGDQKAAHHAGILVQIARHIRCFGWGIDLAIGHGVIGPLSPPASSRIIYTPAGGIAGGNILRIPQLGTLESLEQAHLVKGNRHIIPGALTLENVQPVFSEVVYTTSAVRHFVAFKFVDSDEDHVAYRTDAIKEISGHLRHAAGTGCAGFDKALIDGMIMGHPKDSPRMSILPLPSIGHEHSDGLVRRVLFVEPFGFDGKLVAHLRKCLEQHEMLFEGDCPWPSSILAALPRSDSVLKRFVATSKTWASVTPVLLPGHNQRKQDDHGKAIERACQLVNKSLQQAGIATSATFEISRIPYWRGSLHVRAYSPRQKLAHNPRYHVKITFDREITGPLSIGAGSHVGFGILAAMDGSFSRS
jgi:CRISPR-associated protein Csb2